MVVGVGRYQPSGTSCNPRVVELAAWFFNCPVDPNDFPHSYYYLRFLALSHVDSRNPHLDLMPYLCVYLNIE